MPKVAPALNGAAYLPIPPNGTEAWPKKSAREWLSAFAQVYAVNATSSTPWLPLCAWEGLLVVGHFDTSSSDYFGIPQDLALKVRLPQDGYQRILESGITLLQQYASTGKMSSAGIRLAGTNEKVEFILRHNLAGKVAPGTQPAMWLAASPIRKELLEAGDRQPHFLPLHEITVQTDLMQRIQSEAHLQYVVYAVEEGITHAVLSVASKRKIHSAEADLERKLMQIMPPGSPRTKVKVAIASNDAVSSLLYNSQTSGNRGTPTQVSGPDADWDEMDPRRRILTISRELLVMPKPRPDFSPREMFMWAIAQAIARRGSDVHAMYDMSQTKGLLRLRCDGGLFTLVECPREFISEIVNVVKRATGLSTDHRFPESGKLRAQVGESFVNLRIETTPGTSDAEGPGTELLVVRILSKNANLSTLHDIHTTQWNMEMIKNLIETEQGIIFATGPTGCGKSSTLHLMLKEIASPQVNTLTIENPVEQPTAFAHHIEIDDKVRDQDNEPMSFARGMRSGLRLDPDIIMVGEIRDKDTADQAIQASLTGHLVFTTLHTNGALDVFSRIESLGSNPDLIVDATIAVMAQRLVGVYCPHCHSQTRSATERELLMVRRAAEKLQETIKNPICPDGPALLSKLHAWLKKPLLPARSHDSGYQCPRCNGGIMGRRAVMELFPTFEGTKLRDLVRRRGSDRVTTSALTDHVLSEGYLTTRYDTLRLVIDGVTPFAEYTAKAPQYPSNALHA